MWRLDLRDVVCAACVLDGFVELCGALLGSESESCELDRPLRSLVIALWLVIEFCAPVESSIRAASENLEWMNVLTVSERDDGATQQTMLELKAICSLQIRRKGYVFLWASILALVAVHTSAWTRDPAYRRGRLAQHWKLHRKLWKTFVELTGFVHARAVEWPRLCPTGLGGKPKSFFPPALRAT